MFTGIIEGVGTVQALKRKKDLVEIEIAAEFHLERTNVGDSIAVNGCCLTIISRLGRRFWAELSPETLSTTTLGDLSLRDTVNLERALVYGERLAGHIVQGHVDGVGKIINIKHLNRGLQFEVEIPGTLIRYVVDKGSIAVDGVSLTVNRVMKDRFCVTVIPHTELKTTFTDLKRGERVNLEVDIVGKYIEKLTFLESEQYKKGTRTARAFLKKHGF